MLLIALDGGDVKCAKGFSIAVAADLIRRLVVTNVNLPQLRTILNIQLSEFAVTHVKLPVSIGIEVITGSNSWISKIYLDWTNLRMSFCG